jgi:hypothetical protein
MFSLVRRTETFDRSFGGVGAAGHAVSTRWAPTKVGAPQHAT